MTSHTIDPKDGETPATSVGASSAPVERGDAPFAGLDDELRAELVTFETFFKTFGFKRIHGRVWGLLVLAGQPLSSKEIVSELGISAGAASTTINELADWGAVQSTFDTARRCNLHEPVGNTLSIVATVLRRREQVAFTQFRAGASRILEHVSKRHGPKDPRALSMRSIIATCDLADAMMQLVFSSVTTALGDPQSLLSRAVNAAMKVGVGALGVGRARRPAVPAVSADEKEPDEGDDEAPRDG